MPKQNRKTSKKNHTKKHPKTRKAATTAPRRKKPAKTTKPAKQVTVEPQPRPASTSPTLLQGVVQFLKKRVLETQIVSPGFRQDELQDAFGLDPVATTEVLGVLRLIHVIGPCSAACWQITWQAADLDQLLQRLADPLYGTPYSSSSAKAA